MQKKPEKIDRISISYILGEEVMGRLGAGGWESGGVGEGGTWRVR